MPIKVACAILRQNGKILVAQRSETMSLPLKWEFPGGKIEAGESKEDCVVREIKEELDLEIKVISELPIVSFPIDSPRIILTPFHCEIIRGEPKALEHHAIAWVNLEEIHDLDWTEADLAIIELLKKDL